MVENPVTMARRHVLGELSYRCEPVQNVPVYLDVINGEMLGYVDESSGKYADAITFHLAADICKKLAMGHYTYSFDFNYADGVETTPASKRPLRLSSITLISPKDYEKPIPRGTVDGQSKAA